MIHCIALLLEVVASLPVKLTLFVLLRVQFGKLCIDSIDLLTDLVGCGSRLVFLGVGLLKLLANLFHFGVQYVLFTLDALNLGPNLVLLSLKFFNLRVDLLVFLCFRNGTLKDVDVFDQSSFSLGRHGSRCETPLLESDLLIHVIDCEAVCVHELEKVALISIKYLDLSDNLAHLILVLALSSTNAFCGVDSLGELTLAGLTPSSDHASFTNLSSVLDHRILFVTFGLDKCILRSHFSIKVWLSWLLKNVFLCRHFWNRSLGRKRYLLVLWTVHVVILVDPRVFVLLLFCTVSTAFISILVVSIITITIASTTASTTSGTTSSTTTGTTATSWRLSLLVAFGSVCGLSCGLRSAATTCGCTIGAIRSVVVTCTSSATTATTSRLGPGVASICGCTIGTILGWTLVVVTATTTAEFRLFYYCFSHCCTIYNLF